MTAVSNISFAHLLHGIVVESTTESLTGDYLYSDYAFPGESLTAEEADRAESITKNSTLNLVARVPVIGIAAGVARVALGIIHVIGHLFAALVTQKKGHLYHAAKGACEMLRGVIEALPIVGRIFANTYSGSIWTENIIAAQFTYPARSWWMIKMYNPEKPDGLDRFMDNWRVFTDPGSDLTSYYVKA